MSKFKIGDKVKIVSTKCDEKQRYIGKTYKIIDFNNLPIFNFSRYVLNDNSSFVWFDEELELVQENSIVKNIDKDINVLENAKRKHIGKIYVINEHISQLKEKREKHLVKEMTLTEIEKELGYKVKIKEEN